MLEELKMILELVNNTVGLAHDFGTKALWLYFGMKFLEWLLIAFGCLWFCSLIKYFIQANAGKDTEFMRQCRDRLRIGSPGSMTNGEYSRTTSKILELIDKYVQEKKP